MQARRLCFALLSVLVACGGATTSSDGDAGAEPGSDAAGGAGGGGGEAGAGGGGAAGSGGSGGAAGAGGSAGTGGGGAAGAGGSAGAAGSGGSGGSGGGPVAAPLCTKDDDCELVDDCCTCAALAPSEPRLDCAQNCLVSSCTGRSLHPSDARCVAGQCVLGVDCDASHALCKSLPPSCPPGEVATVVGGCWGGCVAASECPGVPGCGDCAPGDVCVDYELQLGPAHHCVPSPGVCGGQLDCACVGPAVCTGSFGFCSGASGHLVCGCPTC